MYYTVRAEIKINAVENSFSHQWTCNDLQL